MWLWLQQWRCGAFGHLPVTKRGDGQVYEACWICDQRLGPGWDVRDLRPPRKLRRVIAWLRKAA